MSRHTTLIKNTAILAFGKFTTQFMAFLLLPLYTHYLTPAEYGVFDLILTYVTLALPFLTLRTEFAAFRFLIDERKNEEGKTRVISTTLAIVAVLSLVWILLFVTVNSFIGVAYGLFAATLAVAMVISGVFLQFARGLGSNKGFAVASIIAGLVTSVGGTLSAIVFDWGVAGLLGSAALGNILAGIFLFWSLGIRKYVSIHSYDKSLRGELFSFGIPMVPSGLAWWVINGADRTIIGIVLGVTSNGMYAVASKYSLVLVSVANVFGLAWKESASLHLNSKDRDIYFSQTINISLKIFGSLGLVIIAITPLVFGFLFDSRYHEAMLYIPILVVASFFTAVVELYAGVYVAKKMSGKLATTNIFAALISIVLNITFIHTFGLFAAAFAMLIAFSMMAAWRAWDVRKYVVITYDKKTLLKLVFLLVVICGLYYLDIFWASLAGLIIAATAAYLLNRHELGRIKTMVLGRARK